MARSSALTKLPRVTPPESIDQTLRERSYGGLVAQMIDDIDLRLATQPDRYARLITPADFVHRVSIVCGYGSLIAGFAISYAAFSYLI